MPRRALTTPVPCSTQRLQEVDPRIFVPRRDWAFATSMRRTIPSQGRPNAKTGSVKGGFAPEYLYELIYTAKEPKVLGLGLVAVRDMVAFFRHEAKDAAGNPNPLGSHIKHAMGTVVSQSGNFLKTLVHLGFNEDLAGQPVFDAILPLLCAADEHQRPLRRARRRGRPASRAPGLRPELSARVRRRLPRRDPRQHRRHFQALFSDEDLPEDLPWFERHGNVGLAGLPGPHGCVRDERPAAARESPHLLFRRHAALHPPSGMGSKGHGLPGG